MRRIYLDTIGMLALWNAADQWHQVARAAFVDITATGAELWTSTFSLLECGNAAARLPFRNDVVTLREHLRDDSKLIEPTAQECEAAWNAYSRGNAGDAGIVDYVSFEVMRRLGISEAFTNDHHFRVAGFRTLF